MAEYYNKQIGPYELLAELFVYPGLNYAEKIQGIQSKLEEIFPEEAKVLAPFTTFVSQASLDELEELFTRSFEVQAVTTLDLGYLMFGDDYKRAELLVNLNREHAEAKNECGDELPDHLPNILRLIPRMEDKTILNDLVSMVVGPSLIKILEDFKPEKFDLKTKVYEKHHKTIIEKNPRYSLIYSIPIQVVKEFIYMDFTIIPQAEPEKYSDFMGSIAQEMKLE
jgi:nitrate reductase assembly molybdenum cofactor insertion protein NarJ